MFYLLKLFALIPLFLLRILAIFVTGLMLYIPHRGVRWHTRVNLLLSLPHLSPAERTHIERASVANQCRMVIESIKVWGMPRNYSTQRIEQVHGQDILVEALKHPQGMIAVVPHLGTWEMMNAWLNQFGTPTIMYKTAKLPAIDKFILQGRQKLGAHLVPTDINGVKAILKTLKQGGFTLILPDHVPTASHGGVFASFFGHEVLTTTLVSKLVQKTGCKVVGMSCIRSAHGFTIRCEQLPDNIYSTDLVTSATALNQGMESMIMRAPEHYLWSYRRFKKAKNFSNIYKKTELEIAQIAS